jgi:hypothetical protein
MLLAFTRRLAMVVEGDLVAARVCEAHAVVDAQVLVDLSSISPRSMNNLRTASS